MTTPYLHAGQTKLLLQVVKDLGRDEGFREYAYPDPLSKLARTQKSKDWGFKPAREIMRPGTKLRRWSTLDLRVRFHTRRKQPIARSAVSKLNASLRN